VVTRYYRRRVKVLGKVELQRKRGEIKISSTGYKKRVKKGDLKVLKGRQQGIIFSDLVFQLIISAKGRPTARPYSLRNHLLLEEKKMGGEETRLGGGAKR